MNLISSTFGALFLLLGCALAQSQPFEFSEASADTWQGKNAASKEILAYVVEFRSSQYKLFSNDFYFKSEGVAPGEVETFEVKASEPGHVLWVQFADGSEWGDRRSDLLTHRKTLTHLASEMMNAYSHGGEKEFLAYLEANKGVDGFVQHVWRMKDQDGTESAIDNLRNRLASAAKHDKMLAGQ